MNIIYTKKRALAQVLNIDPGSVFQISATLFEAQGREWSVFSTIESHDAAQLALDSKYKHILNTAPDTLKQFDIKGGRRGVVDYKYLNWERLQRCKFGVNGYGSLLNEVDGVERREIAHGMDFYIYERA